MAEKDYKLTVELDNGKRIDTIIQANTTNEAVDKLFQHVQGDWVAIHTETSYVEYVKENKIASILVGENIVDKQSEWKDNPVIFG